MLYNPLPFHLIPAHLISSRPVSLVVTSAINPSVKRVIAYGISSLSTSTSSPNYSRSRASSSFRIVAKLLLSPTRTVCFTDLSVGEPPLPFDAPPLISNQTKAGPVQLAMLRYAAPLQQPASLKRRNLDLRPATRHWARCPYPRDLNWRVKTLK